MPNIPLIQGSNLSYLGRRQPAIYPLILAERESVMPRAGTGSLGYWAEERRLSRH